MATVIGIFEDAFRRFQFELLSQEHNLEVTHIDDTIRVVLRLGKKIYADIIVLQTKSLTR